MIETKSLIVIDTETNGLWHPTKLHVICGLSSDGEVYEWRQPLLNPEVRADFVSTLQKYETIAGHNFIQYDLYQVLDRLIPEHGVTRDRVLDTLVLSRLLNYSRMGGHSIANLAKWVGKEKMGGGIEDWEDLTDEMVERCHSDVSINLDIIKKKFSKYLSEEKWQRAIRLEHDTAFACAEMTKHGFAFDKPKADSLFERLDAMLTPIDESIAAAFPPIPRLVREVHPKLTQHGTLNMTDFRWLEDGDMSAYSTAPFSLITFEEFNPSSPKQIVERLNKAGWQPTEKTKGHIQALSPYSKTDPEKMKEFEEYGWKVCEENLKTLPDTAPKAAKDLAKRIVLESRLRSLNEWRGLIKEDGAIHGNFNPIGAWTHRLSHNSPNMANVPVAKRSNKDNEFETLVNDVNDDMRSLWHARPGWRLVGTDADGLQMRIFAHIVNDDRLIKALIEGSKEDETDIHSLHRKFLGEVCKSRDVAKTFIYAWLLGAGVGKVAEILECKHDQAKQAIQRFISSYPSLKRLKEDQIPYDAKRGYFEGLDGRLVICSSEHLMLAGYLQNGEAIVMKGACRQWQEEFRREKVPFRMVTWPHDEWQTEVPDDPDTVAWAQEVQIRAIRDQSTTLNMNCPLDGSSSSGMTWKETH